MFDLEEFIQECKKAINKTDGNQIIRQLVDSAVYEKKELISALGSPERGGVHRLYVSKELTILNIVWAPRMTLKPHNHNMWAVIGLYSGREDNIFWRRV